MEPIKRVTVPVVRPVPIKAIRSSSSLKRMRLPFVTVCIAAACALPSAAMSPMLQSGGSNAGTYQPDEDIQDRWRALDETPQPDVTAGSTATATSGKVFAMEKIRTFTGDLLDLEITESQYDLRGAMCQKWAVLTSIFEPTDTVRQLASESDWCVVVVGDKNGPEEYGVDGVIYLTPSDQETLPYKIAEILPWNHFGRKNIGYLYAVHHGAEVIYDVDDDNAQIFPDESIPHSDSQYAQVGSVQFVADPSATVHNPYPCFHGPANVWPRGFPLDHINDPEATKCVFEEVSTADGTETLLGVVQSLANHDPDVDAIYRLTHPPGGLPFDFETFRSQENKLVFVPDSAFTPYNAQATLHYPAAFWGMILPVSIHGRVSDIWRSYFTQTLLPAVNARVGFASPWVEQIRNAHSYLADFDSEESLYRQSSALVSFLVDHRDSAVKGDHSATLVQRIEGLAIAMYEYGILGEIDVRLTQAWLQDLRAVGYRQLDVR